MTVTKQFLTWLEINFWNITIPIMDEFSLIGKLMRKAIWLKEKYACIPQTYKAISWAVSGWILGLLGGMLIFTLLP
ncbi:MAG: hypothetical protein JXB38_15375 [Anaerolineales bacterium]|nr:hypothetical protein [Anaerolineales bacterium]